MMLRVTIAWFIAASTCFAAVDTVQEQLSVMQIGAPWRNVSVDPAASMDSAKQLAILGYYAAGSTGPVTLYDMESLILADREIYETPIEYSGIDETLPADAAELAKVAVKVAALTPNDAISQFDFSGLSVSTWLNTRGSDPPNLTPSVPVVMITATFGLASDHNGPIAGERVFFRTPAGGSTSGIVAQRYQIRNALGDLRLIRFTANPGATLARYAVMNNAADYAGQVAWWPDHDLTLRLRVFQSAETYNASYGDAYQYSFYRWGESPWGDTIRSGSGRPALIALSNGTLVLGGTLWSTYQTTAPYEERDYMDTIMASYGETMLDVEVPIGTPETITPPSYTLTPPQYRGFQYGRGLR